MILYVPFFRTLFQITDLSLEEWSAVVVISMPVLVVDEILKYVARMRDVVGKVKKVKTD